MARKKAKITPLQRQLERLASERWARRGVRTFLRMVTLGISLWAIGIGVHWLFGWPLDETLLYVAVLACVIVGAVSLLRPRMKAREVARRLDRRFGLQEQIATALEVNSQKHVEGVATFLVSKAQKNTLQIQAYTRKHQRMPWVEMIALLAMLLFAGGLFLLINLDNLSVAARPPLPLPPLAPPLDLPENAPPEPLAGSGGDGQQDQGAGGGGSEQQQDQNGGAQDQAASASGSDQQSMQELADAMRDLSATRPAAESLDQGDTTGAAQHLRELADQAEQLSEETRRDLSQALREASSDIDQHDTELGQQVRDSASGLEQGPQQSANALENLADAVEELGTGEEPQQQAQAQPQEQSPQQGQSDQSGQGAGQAGNDPPPSQQRESPRPPERLDVDGVPLELQGGDESTASTEGDADEATDEQAGANEGAGRFERNKSQDDTQIDVGDDPLSIPTDLRDVVQEYFSPSD
jgi:hypothetical protein